VFTELNPVAQHQLVTSPAPPGGLLPVSVTESGRPSPIITVPSQGTHSGLAKVAVQYSADSFVVNQTLVLRMNICGKNRHLRQAANRYLQA
jgi:hypothetical protein